MVIMGEFHDFLSFHVLTQNSRSTDGHLLCLIVFCEGSHDDVCWDARLTQMLARLTLVLTTTQS